MNSQLLNFLFSVVPVVLLVLTLVVLVRGLWRSKARLDVLILVASPLVPLLLGFGRASNLTYAIAILAVIVQPFLLLRLLRRFRDVPRYLDRIAVGALVLYSLSWLWYGSPLVGYPEMLAAAGITAIYPLVEFSREAGRTAGVTRWRLAAAAAATLAIAASCLGDAGGWFVTNFLRPDRVTAFGILMHKSEASLSGLLFVCYFLAFAPPRRLMARWQQVEQARFLSETASRDAEDRGRRAVADLDRAVRRSMGNAGVVIALRPDLEGDVLVVRPAAETGLAGVKVNPVAPGLFGRAVETGAGVSGTTAEVEAPLDVHFRKLGAQVLVAPIRTATQTWGVVAVVQRRGSLFPEDDLRLLVQLGRYTGQALDHAHLFVEARDRERQIGERRLQAVETRFGLTLDSIRDYAMCVLDGDGRVATWHHGAQQLFGYSPADVAGQSAGDMFAMTPEEWKAFLEQAHGTGLARREGTCRRKDGTRFIGATTVRALDAEPGEPAGLLTVTKDVTEQRDLENRLRQSQKMEAIGLLAGGIAHDFNNHLVTILGNADQLASTLPRDDARLQDVTEIVKAGERAGALTKQLLAFTRRKIVEARAIDLGRLVSELLPMVRRMIGEQIQIAEETVAAGATIRGDRSQVEQVLLNLAVNARDAMPSGGRLTIRITTTWLDGTSAAGDLRPGSYVLLEVIDTGIGMDADTLGRIFEPFFTTKEFGRGTGLGLATVYGIVRQMGGVIRVESEPGQGTTFRLYFPETLDREALAQVPDPAAAPRGTETLLLVEDDEGVSRLLSRTLTRQGYRVLVAGDPDAALQLAESFADPIHLVITDVVLPGGTGLELVQDLAQLRPGLPALYISGYADGALGEQSTVPKAAHFLQKPFSPADLLTRVRQILSAS